MSMFNDQARLAGGSSGASAWSDITVNTRDGMGRVISYTQDNITYTVTYGTWGISTVAGDGKITTYSYSSSGLLIKTETVGA